MVSGEDVSSKINRSEVVLQIRVCEINVRIELKFYLLGNCKSAFWRPAGAAKVIISQEPAYLST